MKNLIKHTVLIFCLVALVYAQQNSQDEVDILKDVGIEQKLDEQVPLDLVFFNEDSQKVQLSELINDKPVILSLVYYECPMLCTMILNGLLKALNVLSFNVGEEFDVLTVSFDPGETPKMAVGKKETYLDNTCFEGE